MRTLLLLCVSLLICARARGELYVYDQACSPDGLVAFAVNYPPTHTDAEGRAQGCFLHAKSRKRIGDFFFIPDSYAESDHPGTYEFSAHSRFDVLWSADSTCVSITLQRKRWSQVFPFRRRATAFQRLDMPNLFPLLSPYLKDTVKQNNMNAYTQAKRWTDSYRLVAIAFQDAQATETGDENQDWKTYELKAVVGFARRGTPSIKSTEFRIRD